jgi:hypothetical protein
MHATNIPMIAVAAKYFEMAISLAPIGSKA